MSNGLQPLPTHAHPPVHRRTRATMHAVWERRLRANERKKSLEM